MSGHSSRAIANYLLEKAWDTGNALTPLQLIKLVYLCHGWMLGIHGQTLVKEEVEAWRYGPVFRDLYSAVREYRAQAVSKLLPVFRRKKFEEEEIGIMDQVYGVYGEFSGIALSKRTHAIGTPWDQVWKERGQSSPIPNDLIENHFYELTDLNTDAE